MRLYVAKVPTIAQEVVRTLVSTKGIELGVKAPLNEHWEILANWTHTDASETDGTQRLRSPEKLGNFGVRYASLDGAFRLFVSYRLSHDAIDIGGTPLDDYGVVDLSLAYTISEVVELYARVQNAADESYEEIAGYNSAGRALYAGVRLRFR